MMQQEKPEDYVVATFSTHSVRDFLDSAFNAINIKDWSNLVKVDPEFCRPAEVDYLLGKPTKAQEKLGWQATISFDELVDRMVKHDINET